MNEMIKVYKGTEVSLEYLLTGERHQEVVMFVHGAGMNLRQFFLQHEYFSQKYQVLSVSLRGHGLSEKPKTQSVEDYSLEKNRDDLLELLDHLEIHKVHFVGNSAGGIIGFYLYESNPELFQSITTFGTVGELTYSSFTTKLITGVDKFMLRWLSNQYLDFLSKNVSTYEPVQMELSQLFKMSIDSVPYFRGNLGNYSCLSTIQSMKIPYLLIRGEQDKDINRYLKSTLEAIEMNETAQVIDLKSAGHIANLDKPIEFNMILDQFFN